MTWRSCQTSVAGEQRSIERFGEGDVDGIVGREISSQIPHARQKEIVRISAQRKVGEISESHAAAFVVDLAVSPIPTKNLRDFHIPLKSS
jgi:hypothetical protein